MNLVKRAYRYRFYPTDEQKVVLAQTFGCARFVYNWALRLRTDAWYERQERINYTESSKHLTRLKADPERPWLKDVSSVVLQQSLRHLDKAFRNFFAGRAKYPTFKKKSGYQKAHYMGNAFTFENNQLTLAKTSEPLDIRWSRPLKGAVSSVVIGKDPANRYFVSLLVEEKIEPLRVTKNMAGIDLGLTDSVITSAGEKVGNERFFQQDEARLARAQRALAKKQKGSKNRAKARLKVARIHAKIGDRRQDFTHKLTTRLIRENQVLSAESLQVKNMMRNPKLAKAIADVGWSEMVRQLEYKAEWYGRSFVQIDQWYPSSKRCSDCGHILDKLDLKTRRWDCPGCAAHHDRDINAAKNILAAGLAILAGQDFVRVPQGLRDFKPVETV